MKIQIFILFPKAKLRKKFGATVKTISVLKDTVIALKTRKPVLQQCVNA